ncbi:MAG: thioredoxin domain-containing protein, partial [Deltaproteobacteria bacterium]|nr:thioredoxin domain-containing protein [Deltaproteobacteria bacterium]
MTELKKKYEGSVRVVFMHSPMPGHKDAVPAARAAQAAHMQGKFWEYHDLLWEDPKALTSEDLERHAKALGLDIEKWKKDRDSKEVGELVDRNFAMANALGQSGRPAFLINGEEIKGAQPIEKFSEIIDRQIALGDKLLEKGIPAEKVHAVITRKVLDGKYFKYVLMGEIPPSSKAQEEKPQPPLEKQVQPIEIGAAPRKGEGNEVVIVEWSDFECPYCSKVVPLLDEVLEHYGPQRASLVFKQYPLSFHKQAQLAAEASLAAHAQGKFWEMYHKLFDNQKALTRADLERFAQEIGLDMVRFNKELDEGTWKAQVQAEMAEGSRFGVRGTPTMFVGGRRYNGPRDAAGMIKVIDEELLGKKASAPAAAPAAAPATAP